MSDTVELCRLDRLGPTHQLSNEPTPSDVFLEQFARNAFVETVATNWYRFRQHCYVLLRPADCDTIKIDAIWVEPENRRNGLATRAIASLKSYCNDVSGRLILFPVPFRFKVPVNEVENLAKLNRHEFEEELLGPMFPNPSPNWQQLRSMYLKAGFVEQPNPPLLMSEYGKKLGRWPLIYESNSHESD